MRGTSIFDEPQTTGRQLIFDAIIEQDDAVGDVFLKSIARQRAFAPLAGDDGSHAFFFQPVEEPAQFGAQYQLVFQAAKQDFDRVNDDALGADRVDRKAEPEEKTF